MDDAEKVRVLLAAIDRALAANRTSTGRDRNGVVAGVLESALRSIKK